MAQQYISEKQMPAVLVINKIDTVKKEELLNVIATYAAAHEFEAVVPISARTGEGLDDLLGELSKFHPGRPFASWLRLSRACFRDCLPLS